jgi:hypothetical protein
MFNAWVYLDMQLLSFKTESLFCFIDSLKHRTFCIRLTMKYILQRHHSFAAPPPEKQSLTNSHLTIYHAIQYDMTAIPRQGK